MAVAIFYGLVGPWSIHLKSQTPSSQTISAQTRGPKGQSDAGGAATFDAASVKRHDGHDAASAPEGSDRLALASAAAQPTGGAFSVSGDSLLQYIYFAYNLKPYQYFTARPQFSRLSMERYDIEAHAAGNPGTDQLRLMMQALLAARFKLKIHYETRPEPVLALVWDRTLEVILHMQPHSEDVPCSAATARYIDPPKTDFPQACGAIQEWNKGDHWYAGARNITMQELADQIGNDVNRQVVDKTERAGKYDLVIDWTPQRNRTAASAADFRPGLTGTEFENALKEQLALKLVPQKSPVEVLVIDHVEEPTPN